MSNCNAFIFVGLSAFIFSSVMQQYRKMHQGLTFNLCFWSVQIIYVNDANMNTAYLYFVCRQSILKNTNVTIASAFLWILCIEYFKI